MFFKHILSPFRRLKQRGILGMNKRNGDFIQRYNPRSKFPLVDNKKITKELAQAKGVAVPKLYAVIEIERQIAFLADILDPYADFVVKPAHGSGGEGILVIVGNSKGRYRKASGFIVSLAEIKFHISNILSGMYSLGGSPDIAIIEYRVKFDPVFQQVSYGGVPDIRTIVFRGIPTMAMIRLPTRMSDGKANLHQGAIGVSVDIESGTTETGVWQNKLIDQHPDTGANLSGLEIPHWSKILFLTARCHDLVELGYIGVDIVLDRDLGPLMLEINARPGLNIQLANRTGLLPKLQHVEAIKQIPTSISERIAIACSLKHLKTPGYCYSG